MSFSKWVDNWWYIHSGLLFSNKRKWTTDKYNVLDAPEKLNKRNSLNKLDTYDSVYIMFSRK